MTDRHLAWTCERLGVAHASELYAHLLDKRLYRFIPERPPRSLEALQREYGEFSAGAPAGSGEVWLNWAIRSPLAGCVGTLQATRFADGHIWVGYKIVPAFWGQGFATEALAWLVGELAQRFQGQPIWAAVDTRNTASVRVLQKCGFELIRQEPAELHGEATEDFIYRASST